MLIEFSVSNYRSFRDKQTLSMVAAPRLRKKENVITPQVKGEKLPDLLKVAAVYGPNASGKSNLLLAMDIFLRLTERNPCLQDFPDTAFAFDSTLRDQPSYFEWHFICLGLRYSYELAIKQQRVVLERMMIFPSGKEELLYERVHTLSGDQFRFGSKLEGSELVHQAWRDLTGPMNIFMQQAVNNSKEELRQLNVPYQFLRSIASIDSTNMIIASYQGFKRIEEFPEFAKGLPDFFQAIDVPITAFTVKQGDHPHLPDIFKKDDPGLAQFKNIAMPPQVSFTHQTDLGKADFDFSDESNGTRNLMGFWLIWEQAVMRRHHYGAVLAVDEIDSSLHPNIVIALVKEFLQKERTCQLIFTTHDTHLMDAKILRRDQFWLTERDANGATQLRSIHDFAGRESEDIEKRYYEGRYRGLPLLRRK